MVNFVRHNNNLSSHVCKYQLNKKRCFDKLAILYNFTSVFINIPSCSRDESKTSFPLQEEIFVYSRVIVQLNSCIMTNETTTF